MSEGKKRFGRIPKVPVVMQMEVAECGAACLDMVLAYYGKWIPLEEMRVKCGVSRNGSNAKNILVAARNEGMEAKGFKFEPEELKEHGIFPCIVFWEFNHFIVVRGFKGKYVYINDPARGSLRITKEKFDEGFTGVTLMFEPEKDFCPSGSKKSVIDFAKKRLSGTGEALMITAFTAIAVSIFAIVKSGFTRFFIDQILSGYDKQYLYPFVILLFIIVFAEIIVRWIQAVMAYKVEGKFASIGAADYMWKVFHLPIEFFSQRLAGDIQQRKNTNEAIANSLINTLSPLVLNTSMMIFYLFVMIRYSLLLSAIGLFSVLVNIFLSRLISSKRINISRVMMRDRGKLYSATVGGIEMIESIKASGSENGYFERWSGYQASVNRANAGLININAYMGLLPFIVSAVTNVVLTAIGILLAMDDKFTIGMIIAFQGFFALFKIPAEELTGTGQILMEMQTDMERIEDVLEYPDDNIFASSEIKDRITAEKSQNKEYEKLSGKLEIRNLSFGYSKLENALIKDFDLSLNVGESVALVGSTGCGKSTLGKLISGLYTPWTGEILFDGKRIDEIERKVFTGSLSVVDQNIILFEDSIANNIKMWDETIEDFEMILAARDAQIHEMIMNRKNGYGYRLHEGGSDLSGGERQRIEIARVLAQDPTILIMDEATSALDADTEKAVMKAIRDRGITTVIIAHRLSTVRDCDEIIVLDNGRIVERGNHDSLMAEKGRYYELIMSE